MVEELARWKASLMQKNRLLLDSNKQMLETTSQIRSMQASVLRNLKFLAQLKSMNLPSSNVSDKTSSLKHFYSITDPLHVSDYL